MVLIFKNCRKALEKITTIQRTIEFLEFLEVGWWQPISTFCFYGPDRFIKSHIKQIIVEHIKQLCDETGIFGLKWVQKEKGNGH